jgi:RNA polymerase sigma-70 factor (ECF subfamily)
VSSSERAPDPASPDQELVARAAAGDGRAFRVLYERYASEVYRYVRLRAGDDRLAEDLTQDVFVSVYRALPRYEWQGHIRPWLLRCAHNVLANHWRSVSRRPALVDLPDETDQAALPDDLMDLDSLGELADSALSSARLEQALARLTEGQRQVVALRFGMGLSVAEAAEVMARTPNAVRCLQVNALAAIRRQLAQAEAQ